MKPLQKLPKKVDDLGKIIVATGFEKWPKVQYIAQSGHTAFIFFLSLSLLPSTFLIECFTSSMKEVTFFIRLRLVDNFATKMDSSTKMNFSLNLLFAVAAAVVNVIIIIIIVVVPLGKQQQQQHQRYEIFVRH